MRDGERYRFRDSPIYGHKERVYAPLTKVAKDDAPSSDREHIVLYPFRQIVCDSGTLFYKRTPAPVDRFVGRKYRVEKAEQIGSEFKAVLRYDWEGKPGWSRVSVVFDKKHGDMITEYVLSISPDGKDKTQTLTHNEAKWKSTRYGWVPIQYEGLKPTHHPDWHAKFEFDWRVGNSVPDDVVNPAIEDWREPIRKLFDVEWQRAGNFTRSTASLLLNEDKEK